MCTRPSMPSSMRHERAEGHQFGDRAGRAQQLAQALADENPQAVVAALNTIITLDYAAAIPGGAGGFNVSTDTEGLRILAIRSLSITWT